MKRIVLTLAVLAALGLSGLYARQVIHQTVQSRVPGQRYIVSLGDSVASGAGLRDGGRPGDCDLSDKAYPFSLGRQLHEPVEQFACSGATIALSGSSQSTVLGTQYDVAKPFITGSDVIVTAGANDVGWLQVLLSCAQTNCATSQNHTALTHDLGLLDQRLTQLLSRLQQDKPHRIIVNNYYDLFAAGDSCAVRYGITSAEVSFIRTEEARLNATIVSAAQYTKATPVAIDFSGHMLCDSQSWIQGVTGKAPLHPTTAGQQHIATQDATALLTSD